MWEFAFVDKNTFPNRRKMLENIQKLWQKRAFCREIIALQIAKRLAFFCKQRYNNYKVERSGEK